MRTAAAVPTGRWARLLLLACTLVGLAAMHTLGHGAHAAGGQHAGHGAGAPASAHVAGGPATAPGADGSATDRHAGGTAVDRRADATAPGGADHLLVGRMAVALMTGVLSTGPDCPGGDCRNVRALPAGDTDGGLPGWSICLAVLGGFAAALLVVVLLLAGVRAAVAPARRPFRASSGPRAPPHRLVGLRLATVSVLRR